MKINNNNNNKNTDGIMIIILDNGMEIKTRNPHGTEGIIGMISNAISKVTDIHGNKVDVRGINTITFASSLPYIDDPRRVLRKNYDCKLNDYDGDNF